MFTYVPSSLELCSLGTSYLFSLVYVQYSVLTTKALQGIENIKFYLYFLFFGHKVLLGLSFLSADTYSAKPKKEEA